ncbi:hypothetical protein ACWCQQ_38390 [Streptomyces sp. NPDC002143]
MAALVPDAPVALQSGDGLGPHPVPARSGLDTHTPLTDHPDTGATGRA